MAWNVTVAATVYKTNTKRPTVGAKTVPALESIHKQRNQMKNQRGFSLTDSLILLGILTIVAFFAFVTYPRLLPAAGDCVELSDFTQGCTEQCESNGGVEYHRLVMVCDGNSICKKHPLEYTYCRCNDGAQYDSRKQ